MDNTFKFGFWNYLPVGTIDKDIVYKWKDLNCNLFMSFRFVENESKKEDMIALLDEAHKLGIQVIINDERTEYNRLKTMSREEYVKGAKEAIEDFGSHPATFGFYGGDEPFSDQEDNFCFVMRTLKQLCPNKHHFGNLLPYWSGLLAEPSENYREDEFYYEKINRIIKEGQLDILAFDQYTQLYDETKDQKAGIKSFLNAMNHFVTIANNHNIPLYVSLLSIGHFSYREPTEIDLKWQINIAAAMGASAIIWFYFHQTAKDYGFLNPPFLGERAYITPMYGMLQRQQYVFNERYREVFDNIEIDSYNFFGEDYGDSNEVLNKKYAKRLDVKHKDLINLVSYGHYRDNPEHKVIIVLNAEQRKANVYSIYFEDGTECHFDLLPGDMRIFEK